MAPSGGGAWLLFLMVVAAPASACYTRLFSFGDSLADTGNYRFVYANDSDPVLRLPYGETFFQFHRGTGRFSNGRFVLDFIAEALGLPFVRPYLSGRRADDFTRGANFAELEKLRKLHPGVTIIYADYYGAAMEVFISPEKYGIEHPLVACCAGGDPNDLTSNLRCGREEYSLCHNPEKYGSWDGIHPSEAMYKAIAMGLV
ncbi:unnamed protein product [Urochloa decumbens]|uniref:GDSL esterase/lipase n=1 Tax=Urochloa decumbens TaxID=240449 RepID=A0ABC8YVX9_9POAL